MGLTCLFELATMTVFLHKRTERQDDRARGGPFGSSGKRKRAEPSLVGFWVRLGLVLDSWDGRNYSLHKKVIRGVFRRWVPCSGANPAKEGPLVTLRFWSLPAPTAAPSTSRGPGGMRAIGRHQRMGQLELVRNGVMRRSPTSFCSFFFPCYLQYINKYIYMSSPRAAARYSRDGIGHRSAETAPTRLLNKHPPSEFAGEDRRFIPTNGSPCRHFPGPSTDESRVKQPGIGKRAGI